MSCEISEGGPGSNPPLSSALAAEQTSNHPPFQSLVVGVLIESAERETVDAAWIDLGAAVAEATTDPGRLSLHQRIQNGDLFAKACAHRHALSRETASSLFPTSGAVRLASSAIHQDGRDEAPTARNSTTVGLPIALSEPEG